MKLARAAAAALVSLAALSAVSFSTTPAFAQGRGAKTTDNEELALAVGQTKTLSAKDVKNFSEGVPGVIDVRLTSDGSQFIIAGKKQGQTTLLLIKNDGSQVTWSISVFQRDPAQVEKEVNQLIDGLTGVRLRRVGARFVLEGAVNNESEMRKVQQIVSLYQGQVESLVTQGPGGGGTDRKLLVRLDFFFVQYDKTSSYAVGLGWPASIGGTVNNARTITNTFSYDFISGTTTTAQASIVNQPLPELDIAMRHGWAKVLKQSTVISSNGSEATFNSGGEQNFISSTGLQATLVKIQFGTNVTVLPRYDSQTREVEIKLDADVSDLTPPASSGTTLPGRNTTKLSTFVNLKLGQALILSGIRTREERHDVNGLPGLSQIPVLGLLFGSHADNTEEIEGAVFIIPSIIETVPRSSIEVIKNALAAYDDYSGDIERVDSFNKTPPSATK